ncbi:hypothetical protein V8F20_002461 [Naviculisporaceae sp. PSN 640]
MNVASSSNNHPTVCALCNNPPSIPCPTCQDILYCSAACQTADASIHKQVCAAFNGQSPPPKPDGSEGKQVLGVLFPVDSDTPRLVLVRIGGFNDEESGISFQEAEVSAFFDHQVTPEAIHSERNRVRNRDTRSMLEVWQVPSTAPASSSLSENACIVSLAALNTGITANDQSKDGSPNKPFHDWKGPVLVLFMTRSTGFMVDPGSYRDCQLQDFRDAVDFVVDYGNKGHEKRIKEALESLGKETESENRVEEVLDAETNVAGEVRDSGEPAQPRRPQTPPPTSFVIEMEG